MPYRTNIKAFVRLALEHYHRKELIGFRNLMPILAGLQLSGNNRVLDFGGGLGFVYFDIAHLGGIHLDSWRVVDYHDVVEYGNANYADSVLSFHSDIESACHDTVPGLVLCAYTLQYHENPYQNLSRLAALQPDVFVLHGLPLAAKEKFMVQKWPPACGMVDMAVRILAENKLSSALFGYDLISEMQLPQWDSAIGTELVARVYRRQGFTAPAEVKGIKRLLRSHDELSRDE